MLVASLGATGNPSTGMFYPSPLLLTGQIGFRRRIVLVDVVLFQEIGPRLFRDSRTSLLPML